VSGLKSVLGPDKREPAGETLGLWLCASEARAWSTGDSAGGFSATCPRLEVAAQQWSGGTIDGEA
jgi:hypothetical protein